MFHIDMLPAGFGDALWIEYGDPSDPCRILIDGGLPGTGEIIKKRLLALPEDKRRFERVVVSHIDLDHIGGILNLFRDPPPGLQVGDVWFNGWPQVRYSEDTLGPMQGESLSARISQLHFPHNQAFEGGSAALSRKESHRTHSLPGGMQLTLLGPTRKRLFAIRTEWRKSIEKAGLIPGKAGKRIEGLDDDEEPTLSYPRRLPATESIDKLAAAPFHNDRSKANGSSIALLAEFEGKRALLAGDANSADLDKVLGKWLGDEIAVDAFKLSHHGGRKNTGPDLLGRVHTRNYLISTNGKRFNHPDPETLARIWMFGSHGEDPTIWFNYPPVHIEFLERARRVKPNLAKWRSPDDLQAGIRIEL